MTSGDVMAGVVDRVANWMQDPVVVAPARESEVAYQAWNAMAPMNGWLTGQLTPKQRAAYRRTQQADHVCNTVKNVGDGPR